MASATASLIDADHEKHRAQVSALLKGVNPRVFTKAGRLNTKKSDPGLLIAHGVQEKNLSDYL